MTVVPEAEPRPQPPSDVAYRKVYTFGAILPGKRISTGRRIYEPLLCDPLPGALGQPRMLSAHEVLLRARTADGAITGRISRQSSLARYRHRA
jgi:hypothetical protein